jgi:hypothetical protein
LVGRVVYGTIGIPIKKQLGKHPTRF